MWLYVPSDWISREMCTLSTRSLSSASKQYHQQHVHKGASSLPNIGLLEFVPKHGM